MCARQVSRDGRGGEGGGTHTIRELAVIDTPSKKPPRVVTRERVVSDSVIRLITRLNVERRRRAAIESCNTHHHPPFSTLCATLAPHTHTHTRSCIFDLFNSFSRHRRARARTHACVALRVIFDYSVAKIAPPGSSRIYSATPPWKIARKTRYPSETIRVNSHDEV